MVASRISIPKTTAITTLASFSILVPVEEFRIAMQNNNLISKFLYGMC